MTIQDYINRGYSDFDIYENDILNFADPEDGDEAIRNIEWVLFNEPHIAALAIVMRSYHGEVIDWESL